MSGCIFCKIIKKEMEGDVVYEDEKNIVLNDITPVAPVHLLIIPKKHIITINYLEEKDKELIGDMFILAKKMAKEKGVAESGYRLVFNTGKDSGQTVDHLHLHLIGGEKLPWA